MTLIAFHDGKDNSSIANWHNCALKFDKKMSFVPLTNKNADQADIALVWHPPKGRLAELKRLKLICSLGQGVDHPHY